MIMTRLLFWGMEIDAMNEMQEWKNFTTRIMINHQ